MQSSLTQRHKLILTEAQRSGRVSVEYLVSALRLTPQTIRRDLNHLCDNGHLIRTHGGAQLPSGLDNVRYVERRLIATAEKVAIGRAVAAMVPAGASIFINVGTTTEEVARALADRSGLLIITNNLNVVDILGSTNNEVIAAGGRFRAADRAMVGPFAAEFIRNFKVDLAIIGTSAIDRDGTLLDFDVNEVEVARAIIANARSVILASDSGKLSRSAPVKIANLADLDHFVTDRIDDEAVRSACVQANVNLVETAKVSTQAQHQNEH